MNEAANEQELNRLLKSLGSEPQPLEDIWHARQMLWQELGWDQAQVKLWLYCRPELTRAIAGDGVERFGQANSETERALDLAEEIAKIMQSNGRPLPLPS